MKIISDKMSMEQMRSHILPWVIALHTALDVVEPIWILCFCTRTTRDIFNLVV